MDTLLLTTKTHIPPPPQGIVNRPRLVKSLTAGLKGRLTLVSAPAGYGKTTLVSAWVNSLLDGFRENPLRDMAGYGRRRIQIGSFFRRTRGALQRNTKLANDRNWTNENDFIICNGTVRYPTAISVNRLV